MGFVVFRKDVPLGVPVAESGAHLAWQPEFLMDPKWHRHEERAEPSWRDRKVGFEQPLELEERLLVEGHVVNVLRLQTAFRKAVVNGMAREPVVVLHAREALLLRSRDDS